MGYERWKLGGAVQERGERPVCWTKIKQKRKGTQNQKEGQSSRTATSRRERREKKEGEPISILSPVLEGKKNLLKLKRETKKGKKETIIICPAPKRRETVPHFT